MAKKDPLSLGTSGGNQLLYRYLFRHVESKFGKLQSPSSIINATTELDENFEIKSLERKDAVLTSLSRAEYEIIISKFLKLQYYLSKEMKPFSLLKAEAALTDEEISTRTHLQNIYNFIRDKLDDAFIDSLSEYYLLDENHVDKLWRFDLLEYILIGSMSSFQANRINSIIDEIVTEQVHSNMEAGDETDLINTDNQIVDVKKVATQIYVTPKFEKESWGWQVEEEYIRKPKKD